MVRRMRAERTDSALQGKLSSFLLCPPPSLVPARYLEDLARRALHISQEHTENLAFSERHSRHRSSSLSKTEGRGGGGEEEGEFSSLVTARSGEEIYWKELEKRVEQLRDVLPIETLVRLLTIFTIRTKALSVHPISQSYHVFDPCTSSSSSHATSVSTEEDVAEEEEEDHGGRTGRTVTWNASSRKLSFYADLDRYTKNERLPCIRPLSPRLLVACLREILEDFHLLSPPAVSAVLATYASSSCSSSALVYACIEHWRLGRRGGEDEKQIPAHEHLAEGSTPGVHTPREEGTGREDSEDGTRYEAKTTVVADKKKKKNEGIFKENGEKDEAASVERGQEGKFASGKRGASRREEEEGSLVGETTENDEVQVVEVLHDEGEAARERRRRGDLRDFSPADFSLFVSSLGFLMQQQSLIHRKQSRQKKHFETPTLREEESPSSLPHRNHSPLLSSSSAGEQPAASLSLFGDNRLKSSRVDVSESSRTSSSCPVEFFHDCCIYTRENAAHFSLFSFEAAVTALTSGSFINLPDHPVGGGSMLKEPHSLETKMGKRAELHTPHAVDTTDVGRASSRDEEELTRMRVLDLLDSVDIFVRKWKEESLPTPKDGRNPLVNNLFQLLQLSRLMHATARCRVYIHLTSLHGRQLASNPANVSQEIIPENSSFCQGGKKETDPKRKGEEALAALLSHVTESLKTLHEEIDDLPRFPASALLEGGKQKREEGRQKAERQDDDQETEAEEEKEEADNETTSSRPSNFSYLPMSPGVVYTRNLLLAAGGIAGSASLLLLAVRLPQDSFSLDSKTSELLRDFITVLASVIRERGASGVHTPHLPVLFELFSLHRLKFLPREDGALPSESARKAGEERGQKDPDGKSVGGNRLKLHAVLREGEEEEGDESQDKKKRKRETFLQTTEEALRALSLEIVRRYAALSVEEKKHIKLVLQSISWKADPYLLHCLTSFTACVSRHSPALFKSSRGSKLRHKEEQKKTDKDSPCQHLRTV